ncbi:MAG: hypothetical protein ABL963_01565 [Longimicrobiales bacterium]
MRARDRVLQSLDNVYRSAFTAAEEAGDKAAMDRLDIEYQREQLHFELLLDIRELLLPAAAPTTEEADMTMEKATSFLEKAQQIRRLTRLVP